ncbi:chorismate--pyruvate lyase family protein [Pseudomonas leptonychotis]|uniref:chorismate--pyruvate lyase family protein n=1 Tax=Pseudomonas leptonychotis TaxID=2448482 RepID=UPI0039EEF6C9
MPHAAPTDLPNWLLASQLHPPPAAEIYSWLFVNQDSLTQRLIELSADHFSVLPLNESWQRLRSDECAALNVAEGSQGWVREVYLRGHQQPWVFARSVAARSALEESDMGLDQLGSRSLGELLFSNPAFARGPLQASRYPANWLPEAVRSADLWARRSCFSRGTLSVLVAEVFLPAFWVAARLKP